MQATKPYQYDRIIESRNLEGGL